MTRFSSAWEKLKLPALIRSAEEGDAVARRNVLAYYAHVVGRHGEPALAAVKFVAKQIKGRRVRGRPAKKTVLALKRFRSTLARNEMPDKESRDSALSVLAQMQAGRRGLNSLSPRPAHRPAANRMRDAEIFQDVCRYMAQEYPLTHSSKPTAAKKVAVSHRMTEEAVVKVYKKEYRRLRDEMKKLAEPMSAADAAALLLSRTPPVASTHLAWPSIQRRIFAKILARTARHRSLGRSRYKK